MKAIVFSFLCLVGVTSFANVQISLPSKLTCQAVSCIKSIDDTCSISRKPFSLDGLSLQSKNVSHEDFSNKIVIDYSEGDQFLFYTFRADDLNALNVGKVQAISGLLEDGYSWVNGYNVRFQVIISCSK